MKSTQSHRFSQIPRADIQRSSFDRSHGLKTTFNVGDLVPIYIDEALPGDSFNLRMNAFTRLATPLHPFMDNLFLDTFFFAVPKRLVWDNFQKFMGEQENPGDSTDFLVPTVTAAPGGFQPGNMADYFGIPTLTDGITVSALPFRAYNLIWNEWFRDQNLQDSASVAKDDTNIPASDYPLLKRGKRHDYFTSCLPWPQKGDSVNLPLGTQAPLATDATATSDNFSVIDGNGNARPLDASQPLLRLGIGEPVEPLYADLSEATSATINELRQAFQLQKLFERDARGGTRYTEIILSHFNVHSPDARLQRPEFLGGGTSRINVNPIAQTSSTDATSPQGNLAAMGTGVINGHGFTKSFTEHTILIGLASVRADLTYQQGIDKQFLRRTRYDFYWPVFSHLGEQAVLNKEIYAQGTYPDDEVFGYQERYADYRYKPSRVTNRFRSSDPQSLDTWHLAQDFAELPTLSEDFIQEAPPIDRVLAVTDQPNFLFDSYFALRCARPMPVYSVPGLIDHF